MINRFTITFLFLLLFSFTLSAQLVNNGATIIVKNGATLHVDSDVTNTTGTLQLESNATLEVSGDFTSESAATFDADANSLVKFFGSASKNIKSGGDDFGKILMNKDAAIDMSLVDAMDITTNLDFTPANGNKLILGSNKLTLASGATVTNYDATHYVQADGSGTLEKRYAATGTFTFPIGDTDEYSPIDVNVTGGTLGSSAAIAVKVTDAVHPNKYSDADAYITRYWNVDATDITSLAATLTGTYTDADVTGTEANIKGASYISDWDFSNASGDAANNTVTGDISADADFTGMNYYGKLNLTFWLQGPYNSGTSEMKTLLNSNGLLPLTSPYDATTVSAIPNSNIVDWVKIEYTDLNSATKSYSLFVDKTGTLVDTNGVAGKLLKDINSSSDITVLHRNHLGIRTASPQDFATTGEVTYDFTSSASQALSGVQADLGGGEFGMYAGNANGDSSSAGAYKYIRMTGPSSINDYQELISRLGGVYTTIVTSVYDYEDLNMDGNIRMTGPSSINDYSLLLSVLGGVYTTIITRPF